jgi:hypothetical protein
MAHFDSSPCGNHESAQRRSCNARTMCASRASRQPSKSGLGLVAHRWVRDVADRFTTTHRGPRRSACDHALLGRELRPVGRAVVQGRCSDAADVVRRASRRVMSCGRLRAACPAATWRWRGRSLQSSERLDDDRWRMRTSEEVPLRISRERRARGSRLVGRAPCRREGPCTESGDGRDGSVRAGDRPGSLSVNTISSGTSCRRCIRSRGGF